MKYLTILIIHFTAFNICLDQNDLSGKISNWDITSHIEVSSGTVHNQSSLIILNDNTISWGPSNDEMEDISVESITGNWDSSTNQGDLTCAISMEGSQGEVIFKGDNSGMTISINLTYTDGSTELLLSVGQMSISNN